MSFSERKQLYESIINYRKKPLISYVTSIRPNLGGIMAGDAITPIIEQINSIPEEERKVDFLIISNGGDPITALRIIGLLRERFDQISGLHRIGSVSGRFWALRQTDSAYTPHRSTLPFQQEQ